MLSIIKPPKNRYRQFAVYDGEWYPDTMQLRMMGYYDGVEYKWYKTAAEFLQSVLIPENHNLWMYAHAGGLADVQYLFDYLVTSNKYRVSAAFSGSSAIIVDVFRGRYHWRFLDSYWLIREPLKRLGEKLGMPKGEVDFYAPLTTLLPYNRQDCLILYEGIRQLQELVVSLGGELCPTIASTALRLFRRQFLSKNIETSSNLNERLRPAYTGGRTEVWDHRPGLSGYVYDINSSYPNAMLSPQPGRLLRHSINFPRKTTEEYIADVTIDIPETVSVPPIPHVAEGSLFFDIGSRRTWLCRPEIELALSLNAKISKVHEVVIFAQNEDLAKYASEIYNRRKSSTGYMQTVYKYLGNAAYGKFGESNLKQKLLVRPNAEDLREAKAYVRYNKGKLYPLQPGVYLLEVDMPIPHGHVPFAAYITSHARVNLAKHLMSTTPFYCDTDSIATADATIKTSNELGDLKLEKTFAWAHFYAPKLYALQMPDDPPNPPSESVGHQQGDFGFGKWTVRAKGFRGINPHEFFRLQQGEGVELNRMLRIRELFSKGEVCPISVDQAKRLLKRVRPKRKILDNNQTTPWHTSELDTED